MHEMLLNTMEVFINNFLGLDDMLDNFLIYYFISYLLLFTYVLIWGVSKKFFFKNSPFNPGA